MTGRIVVVTGSEGGIGSAVVEAFRLRGDTVEGIDLANGFDVSDPVACERAVSDVLDRHGRISVLCNNAGVGAVGDATASPPAEWQRVFAVNVFGAAYMISAVLPTMRAAGQGVIVNTCSVLARIGLKDRVVYSASKGALSAMTRAVAADEARAGVRVNCVSPATVDGHWVRRNADLSPDPEGYLAAMRNRQPTGRLIAAEAVACAVVFLADDGVGLTGVDLAVDAGLSTLRVTD